MASSGFNLKTIIVVFCVFGVMEATDFNETLQYREIIMSLNNVSQSFMFRAEQYNISPECTNALLVYGIGLLSQEEWAFKMFDAMSKLQSGILEGNMYNLGAYNECQSIRDVPGGQTTVINGKYCLGSFTLQGESPFSLMWSMCAPDACSADDLNTIMNVTNILPTISMGFAEELCNDPSKDPKITDGDIALIVCFGVIGLIMFLSSLYDIYLRYYEKKTMHPLLLAFSVVTNSEKLFATRSAGGGGDQMGCLHGVRSLSMMWVVIGHMFSNMIGVPMANSLSIYDFYKDGWTMYIRGATVSVDSFFLMSGILMIYVYLKSTKDKQCFNVLLYYVHRYLRLTPALAAVLVVHLTILKHFGSGPFWPVMMSSDGCKNYWWSLLLYVQNYVNPAEICIGQSWYLSVDTQLFFVSPLILLPLKRWPIVTLISVLVAAIASISYGFAISWIEELRDINTLMVTNPKMNDYMQDYYIATQARAAPWLIGIIVGYYIYKIKSGQRKFVISKFVNVCIWSISLAVLALVVFYDISQDDYNRLAQSFYIALNRPVWSLALAWVIFACVTGYGGWVNDFLSAPVFQVLARLAYSMYLTHYTIIQVMFLSTKQPLQFSNARVMYDFWSLFVLIALISIIWTLAFESPVIIIEKQLLGGAVRKPQMAPQPMESPNQAQNYTEINFSNENPSSAYRRSNGIDNNAYVNNEATQNGDGIKS